MVIYDVYEELEKPDEREILFINKILEGKFGCSIYEEMEEIFHPCCNIKNDHSDVIIDRATSENVISLNMVDKFQSKEEEYTPRYNQPILGNEKDVHGVTKILVDPPLLANNYESLKWEGDLKSVQRTFQFSRERRFFHTNVKMLYLSTTTLILFGYVLLSFKLLMLLIYLQMLKKQSRLEDELLLTRGE